jgi:hypothetical protein
MLWTNELCQAFQQLHCVGYSRVNNYVNRFGKKQLCESNAIISSWCKSFFPPFCSNNAGAILLSDVITKSIHIAMWCLESETVLSVGHSFSAFVSLHDAGTRGANFILCARAHSFGVGSLRGELIELPSDHRDDCRKTLSHQQHWGTLDVAWHNCFLSSADSSKRKRTFLCHLPICLTWWSDAWTLVLVKSVVNYAFSLSLLKRDVIAFCYAGLSYASKPALCCSHLGVRKPLGHMPASPGALKKEMIDGTQLFHCPWKEVLFCDRARGCRIIDRTQVHDVLSIVGTVHCSWTRAETNATHGP